MDNSSGVHVFETALTENNDQDREGEDRTITYEDLIEEVLNELLFERTRSQQAMQVSSEELCDEVAARCETRVAVGSGARSTYRSSRGEMKTSLRLMI